MVDERADELRATMPELLRARGYRDQPPPALEKSVRRLQRAWEHASEWERLTRAEEALSPEEQQQLDCYDLERVGLEEALRQGTLEEALRVERRRWDAHAEALLQAEKQARVHWDLAWQVVAARLSIPLVQISGEQRNDWLMCGHWCGAVGRGDVWAENCAVSLLGTRLLPLPGHVCPGVPLEARDRYQKRRPDDFAAWLARCAGNETLGIVVERVWPGGRALLAGIIKQGEPLAGLADEELEQPSLWTHSWTWDKSLSEPSGSALQQSTALYLVVNHMQEWYADHLYRRPWGRPRSYTEDEVFQAHQAALSSFGDRKWTDQELAAEMSARLGGPYSRSNLKDARKRGELPGRVGRG